MQNEILLVADAVSGEKGLPKSSIFEAIEMVIFYQMRQKES